MPVSRRRDGGFLMLPTGDVVRGAKKGGITDHIAGPHLIPNVGREAMVPAEVVVRRRPAPKPKAQPPPQPKPQAQKASKRKKKGQQSKGEAHPPGDRRGAEPPHPDSASESPSHDRDRDRTRTRSRTAGRRGRSEASDSSNEGTRRGKSDVPERVDHTEKLEKLERHLEGRHSRSPDAVRPPASKHDQELLDRQHAEEARQREQRRLEEEQRKLRQLEEARKKKEELDNARRKKLGGLFALTEDDDEDDEAQKARAAMEKRLAEERRSKRERPTSMEGSGALGSSQPAASSSTVAIPARVTGKEGVTALDIDGSAHDHKFSKVWKDWDASKKDDPGEIARQFMKVSAISGAATALSHEEGAAGVGAAAEGVDT
eukprot:CAMPEP_0176054334 /NCGR_PEP_ID=MMETSP0120_2-20121206/27033_1 /TAXON_ID=160619 /ORGANISM="Kryptoperidinium foliaceum, Strain CCMP 1326" /LENGTH=372 /DNA_ID=CAMNT_0017387799 /DNA_START=51 /DNA_END=1170 /DNA_ORIENTATION=+